MIDEGWDQIFKNILDQMQFFIAKEVLKELEHFHIAKENYWSKGIILKTLNKSFNVYIRQEFDETDASLLEYSELNILQ